jgi:hypothetical protein
LKRIIAAPRRAYGLARAFEQLKVCSNPVFVIGSPRSGTTMLAWSLAHHSWLWTSGESTLIREIVGTAAAVDRALDQARVAGKGSWLQDQRVERSELLAHLGAGVNALYTSRSRGRRWIDHSPSHTLLLDELGDLFPSALFLHVLRDGRQVVHSMTNFLNALPEDRGRRFEQAGYDIPWLDFEVACATWSDYVERAMWFVEQNPERCHAVLHRQIVSEPWRAFRDIFAFLDLPFEHGPVSYVRVKRVNSSFQDKAVGDYPNPWHEWSKEEQRTFVRVCGRTQVQCGLAAWDELEYESYEELVERVRVVACVNTPAGATLIVASGGDESLIALDGRRARHFLGTPEGFHAGHNPADANEAIVELEKLREQGADFLLFPRTSLWWLDHYGELRSYLDQRYPRLVDDETTCVIFSLRNGGVSAL